MFYKLAVRKTAIKFPGKLLLHFAIFSKVAGIKAVLFEKGLYQVSFVKAFMIFSEKLFCGTYSRGCHTVLRYCNHIIIHIVLSFKNNIALNLKKKIAFQINYFDFLSGSAECFESSAVCFKTITRPSVLLKTVYANLVCKKH